MFDEDGNGFIDLNELKTAMSGVKLRDDEWRDLIIKYDADNDGVVSIETLLDLFNLFRYQLMSSKTSSPTSPKFGPKYSQLS
jgi:Ca2+-binding EF-hand superfamily protein